MHMSTRLVEHLLADSARALDGVFHEVVERCVQNRTHRTYSRCPAHMGILRINSALARWNHPGVAEVTFATQGRSGEHEHAVGLFR